MIRRTQGIDAGGVSVNEYWSNPVEHKPTEIAKNVFSYRNYVVQPDPPPIPDRSYDWNFHHDDFDGAPDSGDTRCGYAASPQACYDAIDELEQSL